MTSSDDLIFQQRSQLIFSRSGMRLLAFLVIIGVDCISTNAGPTFAVIGDYGRDTIEESKVATMIKAWNVDALLTTGDNNYPNGIAASIDRNIGKHFQEFIGAYRGSYGEGAGDGPFANRFFPTLGNHDWRAADAQPYLDYFTLPGAGYESSSGNERYYDFVVENTHFFAVDSDISEPDGNTVDSRQAAWLKESLRSSAAEWQVVYFHHSPYSSSSVHGNDAAMQFPFKAWGADVVLTGHDHLYERLIVDGLPYFVVGNSGANLYEFAEPICGSRFRLDETHGALKVTIDGSTAVFEMWTIDDGADGANGGMLVDRFETNLSEPLQAATGDGNWDGDVDVEDLNAVRNFFGASSTGDADRNCRVELDDLNLIRNNFGGMGSGDTNGDGKVDAEDLNGVRNNLGALVAADVNRDGVVDVADLNHVRNNFGATANLVPEPSAFLLMVFTISFAAASGSSLLPSRRAFRRDGY